MSRKIGLAQIDAAKKAEFPNLKKEMEEVHSDLDGLENHAGKVTDWIAANAPFKTLIFYFNRIRQDNQKISLFCPMKGKAVKMYVNMGTSSALPTNVEFKDANEVLIGNIVVQPGNVLSEAVLNHDIDYETLKVIVRGEMQLQDISVSVEVVPEGSTMVI